MPLPTDYADLESEDPQPRRSARAPVLNDPVTRVDLHQVHKEVNKIGAVMKTRHDELAAKFDASMPGADIKTHYDQHARIVEREIDKKKLWNEVIKALVISFTLLAFGAIGTGLWNYVKFNGGLFK